MDWLELKRGEFKFLPSRYDGILNVFAFSEYGATTGGCGGLPDSHFIFVISLMTCQ
jgi:hypothetical protein